MELILRTQMQGTYIPPKSQSVQLKPGARRLPKGTTGFIITHVDDPYVIPKFDDDKQAVKTTKLRVVQRTSDNPLLGLLNRKRISDAQYLAGHKYMGAHLICTGQTGQGVDYSRQRVDCSSSPMTMTEKLLNAQDIIRNANRELTRLGHNTRSANEAVNRMQKIAGEGLSVTQYCTCVLGLKSSKSVSKQLSNLRDDLSLLARHWGLEGQ